MWVHTGYCVNEKSIFQSSSRYRLILVQTVDLQCKYGVSRTHVFALLLEKSSLNGVKVGSLRICCIEFEEVKSVDDLSISCCK